KPERFEGLSNEEAVALIVEEIEALYKDKEIHFPVSVGMSRFMSEQAGGERYDREGLARWANGRFRTQLDPETFRGKGRGDIETILTEASRSFHANGRALEKVDEYLDRAYGERNGEDTR